MARKSYYDALDDLLDRPISYNPAFKKITGRTSAAVWLSQVWYWSKRTTDPDGWFWKSAKECEEETGLTDNEQMSARRLCLELGVVEEKLKGVPATMHYRLIKPKVYELLGVQFPTEQETENPDKSGTGNHLRGKQVPKKPSNLNKVSENTSNNTQGEQEKAPIAFENLSIPQARRIPTLKMYADATGWFPADVLWREVHDTITRHHLTAEKIRAAAIAWVGRGYKRGNVTGILDWAVNGIPNNKTSAPPPAPVEIDKFASLKEMLARQEANQ